MDTIASSRAIRAALCACLAALCFGCGGAPAKPEGPVTVDMQTYERTLQDCPEHLAPCASIRLEYPRLGAGAPAALVRVIEAFIDTTVLTPIDESDTTAAGNDPDSLMAHFLSGYQEFVSSFPEAPGSWTLQRTAHPLFNANGCLSLEFSEESYTGGAHPNTMMRLATFDTRTGRRLTLEDLFAPGHAEALRRLGERAFREAHALAPDADLVAAGFWFEDGRFSLNDNFAVTPEGLRFHFNPYEVGPYALGPTDITLTRAMLADLIRDDGPLAPPA
jgi:Protein of unknown function (DUF3298)/Deacetylase PdaC